MKWTAVLLGLTLFHGDTLIFAQGQAGTLDPSFGSGGLVTTLIRGHDQPNALAIQQDGKIILAGFSFPPWDFAVARYNSNGSFDATFGSGGLVLTDFGLNDDAWAVAIQQDGKIILAGETWGLGSGSNFALARYMPNGSLDPTFGSQGKVVSNIGGCILTIAIQADGKILVGATWGFSPQRKFQLARYNSNGSLDTSFGSGGSVLTDFGGDAFPNALALQPNGKMLMAGAYSDDDDYDFALARYNADGSLDTTFSSDGRVVMNLGKNDFARALSVQPDGKILASGVSQNSNGTGNFALARYNSNGSLDTNFGSGGKVITNFGGDDEAKGIAIAADGKIVLAGSTCCTNFAYDFALARYTSSGSLDHTFGSGGKVITGFPQGNNDAAVDVRIQTNGKIVAAGTSYGPYQNADFALARYFGDPPPPPPQVCPQGQLFCDFFDDNFLSWTVEKGTWIEAGGVLTGTLADKKALVVAPATLSGCSRCSVTTNLRISGAEASKASLLTHYVDKGTLIEVMFKQQNGAVVVKQRINKQTVAKAKASLLIRPGVLYKIVAAFDGSNYTLIVDGNLLITLPMIGSPNGTVGYQSKSASMIVDDVVVK